MDPPPLVQSTKSGTSSENTCHRVLARMHIVQPHLAEQK
uniref:Uncharacterized protein n=1 Tax=Arundo donax TaxID=35708 RepID=A0A0A8ZAF8_ARUDO